MPVISDFRTVRGENQVLVVNMNPAQQVGGWSVQFQVGKRFGWTSGLINKVTASGFAGDASSNSGIVLANSGNGTFNVYLNPNDTSGLSDGNFAYTLCRTDSGYATVLSEGYLVLNR